MQSRFGIIVIILVAIICVLGVGVLGGMGGVYYLSQIDQEATRQANLNMATVTPEPPASDDNQADSKVTRTPGRTVVAPTPTPRLAGTMSSANGETEALLANTEIPIRDLRLLAIRLRNGGEDLPIYANETTPVLSLGDQDQFWIVDNVRRPPLQFQVKATLQHISDNAYWWVEDGFIVSQRDLEQSAEVFETRTYPTTRDFFGSEWSPGVDNDPRISIFLGNVPGVGGYFASSHAFTQEVDQYSNEREMFLINLNAIKPGNNAFDSVIAHEFQHMIHWHQDRNEETWVNEGMSELAVLLNGFAPDRSQNAYLQQPDLQITTWAQELQNSAPHYGSSYLFMAYFLDQFGQDVMKAVVSEQSNGIAGFDAVLSDQNLSKTFDDVFADFIIANYLNNGNIADGQYGYESIQITPVQPDVFYRKFPIDQATTVRQYGADYIEVQSDTSLTFEFDGSTTVPLLNNQAHSGRYQWYSNRGDDSNATLTRAIDLTSVDKATLNYWTWFDIEEDWDYAYVEVSVDEGKSWTILKATNSTTSNPTGNAYGPGYTAFSGGWLDEVIDLTPYTGQEILLRFEYVTDDATNGPGFAIDDVSIAEIGFFDDMETLDTAWVSEGFIRTDNTLRQRYIVQVIDLNNDSTVTKMVLDENNQGQLSIGDENSGTQAIIVISAQAPVTTEEATYKYQLSP